MANTSVFTMRMDDELKRRIDDAAARDRRSTASLIAVVLERWLDGASYALAPDEIKALPLPGRPRVNRKLETKHPLAPAIEPWLADRAAATLDEVLEGPLKTTREAMRPGILPAIKSFFHEIGWRETFIQSDDLSTTPAWVKA